MSNQTLVGSSLKFSATITLAHFSGRIVSRSHVGAHTSFFGSLQRTFQHQRDYNVGVRAPCRHHLMSSGSMRCMGVVPSNGAQLSVLPQKHIVLFGNFHGTLLALYIMYKKKEKLVYVWWRSSKV